MLQTDTALTSTVDARAQVTHTLRQYIYIYIYISDGAKEVSRQKIGTDLSPSGRQILAVKGFDAAFYLATSQVGSHDDGLPSTGLRI